MNASSSRSPPRIVVVGSSNTDMVVEVDELPRPGQTVLGGTFRTAGGGKGANQAISAARAGGNVSFVGCVGNDSWGDAALRQLQLDRVDVSHVSRDRQKPSGVALILVARQGENLIGVAGGANGRLSPRDVRLARGTIRRARVVLAQLETPMKTICAAAREAIRARALFILNPAPAEALPELLLRQVSVLTPNESEAEVLTGIRVRSLKSAQMAAARLRSQGVKTVVTTLGARGALIVDDRGARRVPGFKVEAVDTVAAGDTFNGALAIALANEEPIDRAVRFANAAAAISVTRRGAQESAPRRREILDLLRRFAGEGGIEKIDTQ